MVRFAQVFLLASLCLAGCAGVKSPDPILPSFPGDNESVAGEVTGSATRGVAVLDVGIEGLQCAEGRVVLARADAAGFIASQVVVLPTTYAGRAAIKAVELEPGTHHIVHYTCRNGANVTYAGSSSDASGLPWAGKSWPVSLAAFTLGPGEVIDVGRLSLKRPAGGLSQLGNKKGKKGVATASVAVLPPESLSRLQEERPELAEQMKPQVMALAPGAADIKLGRCHLTAAGAVGTKTKKTDSASAVGVGMVSTSFTGPEAAMTDCVQEGGKSDQFKALVDGEAAPETGAGASGQ